MNTPTDDDRSAYLAGKLDEMTAALRDHDGGRAQAVIEHIRAEDSSQTADYILDGLIEAGLKRAVEQAIAGDGTALNLLRTNFPEVMGP